MADRPAHETLITSQPRVRDEEVACRIRAACGSQPPGTAETPATTDKPQATCPSKPHLSGPYSEVSLRGGKMAYGRSCSVCGATLPAQQRGRPRLYCSTACQQAGARAAGERVSPRKQCTHANCPAKKQVEGLCMYHYSEMVWTLRLREPCSEFRCEEPSVVAIRRRPLCYEHYRRHFAAYLPSAEPDEIALQLRGPFKAQRALRRWRRHEQQRAGLFIPGYDKRRRRTLHIVSLIAELRCHLCGGPLDMLARVPDLCASTLDHVRPQSHGGSHKVDNLLPAHFSCNSRRGNRGIPPQHRALS
ncbi:HNH endonuclease [Streptomyces sp. NPDC020951]|uniref:HNH endonuclease n=1 Tax=Streptomyces sp. NPDC020951 TaxID=3365104 RepID=UPI0037AF1DB4